MVDRCDGGRDGEFALLLHGPGGEAYFFFDIGPEWPRAYFRTRRLPRGKIQGGAAGRLSQLLAGATITAVRQVAFDRVAEITLARDSGQCRVIIELLGKQSNAVLVDTSGTVQWFARRVTTRTLQRGQTYSLPSVVDSSRSSLSSPFYERLIAEDARLATHPIKAFIAEPFGAYPLPTDALGYRSEPVKDLSFALERHFERLVSVQELESKRASLFYKLERLILAREVALEGVRSGLKDGGKAAHWQNIGQLLLTYQHSIPRGQSEVELTGFDGGAVRIAIDRDLEPVDIAESYFVRAKRAKAAIPHLEEQLSRLSLDVVALKQTASDLELADSIVKIEELERRAIAKRWFVPQVARSTEERPYEGHRIRELLAPGGWTVLYGENAVANDYLTLRVAKPADWWLHVRGSVSAHVVIVTNKQPEKVQRDELLFAAKVAVRNSPSKHAGYVDVDYTLRRYVRRRKGGPPGSVIYDHEKTLHIDADQD